MRHFTKEETSVMIDMNQRSIKGGDTVKHQELRWIGVVVWDNGWVAETKHGGKFGIDQNCIRIKKGGV